MGKYGKLKSFLTVSTAACFLFGSAGCLTGCEKTTGVKEENQNVNEKDQAENVSDSSKTAEGSKAMGRYLEKDLDIPDGCTELKSIQILEDGSMEILARNSEDFLCLYKSTDLGQTWQEGEKIIDLFGMENSGEDIFYNGTLGKDGSILAGVYIQDEKEEGRGSMDYYYCPAGGSGRKLELGDAVKGTFAWNMEIGRNGNLFLQLSGNGILEINPTDGSIVHEYEEGKYTDYMGLASHYLIVITDGEIHYYDISSGKPAEGGDALTAQVKKDSSNVEFGNSSGSPILFLDGDEENTLFYVDTEGLYRYTFGGNMVEQLVDGSLNFLGTSGKVFNCIATDEEGNFYIGEVDYSSGTGETKLFSYTYSADTPTVPDIELTIYSLEENSGIRQAIAMFQKKYPDIYLTMETGISGEDGVTRTDALKTLNTEIMAGKGPDILILDGISSENYIEQGMLEDLSDILKDAGLLSNVETAYTTEDGSIYEMPVKFGIPMIEGKKEDVESVTDLASLADVVEKHREEYGLSSETMYKLPFAYFMYPGRFLKELAKLNDAAWQKEDGTLDETMMKEFLEQAGRIYQAGQEGLEQLKTAYPQAFGDTEQPEYDSTYGIAGETVPLLSKNSTFAIGAVFSPMDFAFVNSMTEMDDSLSYKLWNGQKENCLIPISRIGISSKASQKEAAEKFVKYLFSEEGQMLSKSDGFPVAESVYDNDVYWNLGEAGTVLSRGSSGNSETGQEIEYQIKVPEEDKLKELKALGKTLTIPVLDNEIITSAVCDTGIRYLNGEIGLEEAVDAVMQKINLYLAE